ncbi:DUF4349 domain-containing protein [Streptomyces sp. NPDC020298]|uniref:DUF4349 domain-containing protein n=1 Tax=unclassified Streptomyces TaxID=2593676 RepID=UPI0033F74CA8
MRTPRSLPRPVQALAAVLLAASLALAGCSGADDSGGGSSGSKADSAGIAQEGTSGASGAKARGADAATKAPRLTASSIIRTASLTVQVKDVPKALDEARATAENAGGYVGDESTSRDSAGQERTRVVLRVPTDKYDAVLTDLEGSGKLIHRTAKARDVTDQVVDVGSRVKSQRASVARIRELMGRATKLGDVVTLEGELSGREADLEALLAQQASLKDRTSLATITLSLSRTPVRAAAAGDDSPGFTDALAGGWHAFVTLLRWIALAVGAVLPFAALAALLTLLWLRVVRPRLPRRAPAAPMATALGPLPTAHPAPQPAAEPDEQG